MAEWAQRCIEQGGITVMPHAPNPQFGVCRRHRFGLINAMELMTFIYLTLICRKSIRTALPTGIAISTSVIKSLSAVAPIKWPRHPCSAAFAPTPSWATADFTYENWMAATRAGNTFVTVGPLAELRGPRAHPRQPDSASRPAAARSTSLGASNWLRRPLNRSKWSSEVWQRRQWRQPRRSPRPAQPISRKLTPPGSPCACVAAIAW